MGHITTAIFILNVRKYAYSTSNFCQTAIKLFILSTFTGVLSIQCFLKN